MQEAGIKPKTMDFGKDFVNRKVALMLAGSWLPADFPRIEIDTSEQEKENLEKRLGVVPYPVPNNEAETSTLLGGWLLSILQISENKELVWELVTIMLEPKILAPMLAEYKYLPTQVSIGEGPYASQLNQTIVYYDKLISLIPLGHTRPNIPEFPQIDEHISQAIDEVCHKVKDPSQALADAATKSAKILGW